MEEGFVRLAGGRGVSDCVEYTPEFRWVGADLSFFDKLFHVLLSRVFNSLVYFAAGRYPFQALSADLTAKLVAATNQFFDLWGDVVFCAAAWFGLFDVSGGSRDHNFIELADFAVNGAFWRRWFADFLL